MGKKIQGFKVKVTALPHHLQIGETGKPCGKSAYMELKPKACVT